MDLSPTDFPPTAFAPFPSSLCSMDFPPCQRVSQFSTSPSSSSSLPTKPLILPKLDEEKVTRRARNSSAGWGREGEAGFYKKGSFNIMVGWFIGWHILHSRPTQTLVTASLKSGATYQKPLKDKILHKDPSSHPPRVQTVQQRRENNGDRPKHPPRPSILSKLTMCQFCTSCKSDGALFAHNATICHNILCTF